MILLEEWQIPILPTKLLVDDEMVCIGAVNEGVVIHYIERDIAVLMSPEDLVRIGLTWNIDEPEVKEEEPKPAVVVRPRHEIVKPNSKKKG